MDWRRLTHRIPSSIAGRAFLLAALAAAAYFAGARVGYALQIPRGIVTLWPPAGIMLGLLVRSRRRDWPAIAAGGLVASISSDLVSGYSILLAIWAAAGNIGESLFAAWILTRGGRRVTLATRREVLELVVGAVLLANAVTAVAGGLMLRVGFDTPLLNAWLTWWVGDGLGMLVVAPLIIVWRFGGKWATQVARTKVVEALALSVLLVVVGQLALGASPGSSMQLGLYVTFPLLLWAALRFGPPGAATGAIMVAFLATWNASQGMGPFVDGTPSSPSVAWAVYSFLAVASLTSLMPAAMLEERRAAHARLTESEARYRAIMRTATDAIVRIDQESRIEFANPAIQSIFGYAPEDMIGRPLTDLVPERDRDQHRRSFQRYVETGERHVPWPAGELTGLRSDGTEIPLEVSFGETVEDGRHQFIGVLRDITEKRRAQDALREAEEQVRQSQKLESIGLLAGGIAHDFNNLLTAMIGYGQLVRIALGSGHTAERDLDEILKSADRASALTKQLLAFSRQQILETRILDLADVLRSIEPLMHRLIGEDIDVSIRVRGEIGQIRADPGQVEQVILNLAINARDAMPDGGLLLFDLANVDLAEAYTLEHIEVVPGRYVLLSVTDTGTGMRPDVARRIFEPFFTTKPSGKGTGLGMATVYGIVKQSGGSIVVYSEPDHGSTFKVYFPRVTEDVDEIRDRKPEDTGVASERILVVEDDEALRRLAQRILEQRGYTVTIAATPADALRVVEHSDAEPDLVLTDVVLPGMSGRVMAERLMAKYPRLRVLYMSGYTDDAVVRRGVLHGETHFVQKPFDQSILLRKVREALGSRGPTHE